jgi:8-oxo-dGTP pyrophosphatase MutT (NUDIX family)
MTTPPGAPTPAGRYTGEDVPAVDAATVLLLRDGSEGIEVLLLERHLDSDFAGGAFVFPGGKVDGADRALPPARWGGVDLAWWVPRLGVATHDDALGLLVAGVRETFEEAGVLLAARSDGTPLVAEELASSPFVAARRRLASRDERYDWRPFLESEELVLDLGALLLWSWWVTPAGQHKRFDTRFLAARLPAGQHAAHDDVETTSLVWLRPEDALAAQQRGERVVIYPTRRNLRDLATFPRVDDVWAAAAADRLDRRRIEPSVVTVDGRPMVQHPDGGRPEAI